MNSELTIVLCDNQKNDIILTEAVIREWLAQPSHAGITLTVYSDPHELNNRILSGSTSDIYVLGISAHGLNGIAVGKNIRARSSGSQIIYVTRSGSHALEAYELHALRYIVKPDIKDELFSALDLAVLIAGTLASEKITVRIDGELRSINTDSVMYIENNVRNMRYVLRDGTALSGKRRNISFEDYFAPYLASGRFVQTHKSFIVNADYIQALRPTTLILKGGVQIPISRRHAEEVTRAYTHSRG